MDNNKKGVNPLTAAVVGVAVGAAAVALSKKENRDKLKEKAKEIMDKGEKKFDEAQKKIDNAKDQGKQKLAATLDKASEKVKKEKQSLLE